jgi:hypothetical protein
MLPVPTKKATHSYGPPPNWVEETMGICGVLSVRVQEGRGGIMESVSTWKPRLEEINYLQEGGSVILTICAKQPAVSLHVELEVDDGVPEQIGGDQCAPLDPARRRLPMRVGTLMVIGGLIIMAAVVAFMAFNSHALAMDHGFSDLPLPHSDEMQWVESPACCGAEPDHV